MHTNATQQKRNTNWAFLVPIILCFLAASFSTGAEPNMEALRLAIDDLSATYGERYPDSAKYLERLERATTPKQKEAIAREAMLANPLLDFDTLLLVRRAEKNIGLPANYHANPDLPKTGYDNEIAILPSLRAADSTLKTLYRPEEERFVGDLELDWDGSRLLFSMPGANGRWQVFQTRADAPETAPSELPLIQEPDVDNYDACRLPDGNLIFTSTAPFIGVPCVQGSSHVGNLYHYSPRSGQIRRLTFDQDHNWCPTVLENGRVLYLRWEYSDIPHFAARILFNMNPDGTEQMEFYGSNSYWPNALFYARPVPGHPTKFAAIVGGHHGVARMGELVLFDVARGRHEASGAIQRIPGRGQKVEPIILDRLVDASWPKFLHPFPLSEKYFLVSCKPTEQSLWGIYLADVFDNLTLIREMPGNALFEPTPLRSTTRPPEIPPKVDLERNDAVIYLSDVYAGAGLRGVPRDAVKRLRLFTYHFAYHGMGGQQNRVGWDGPWDIKRVLGTVPVEPDGSALFRVPANTPISIQPLDSKGRALQLMRSWTTAMPGEIVSCAGCHEKQNSAPPSQKTLASRREPSQIAPWYGPTRGFSFKREVQPVLDRHCVGCHDGRDQPKTAGLDMPDFRPFPPVARKYGGNFSPSYLELRRFVRAPSIESDMHLLPPCEFHASTSPLMRMLEAGHHDTSLTPEDWDRLAVWIDLAAPAHGTWSEIVGEKKVATQNKRRADMMRLYAARDDDAETIYTAPPPPRDAGARTTMETETINVASASSPMARSFSAEEAKNIQAAAPGPTERIINLGEGIQIKLVRVPASSPQVDSPFWMAACEITNRQFALFDPDHDSRLEHGEFLQFGVEERGYPLNAPDQPVVRVSRSQAEAFCQFLSARAGERFALPTETQWEHAARAGSTSEFWYGGLDADFSTRANLADASLRRVDTYEPWKLPSGALDPWRPAAQGVNDRHRVSAPVGSYEPNPWGLFDIHGNVWEWTRSTDGGNGKAVARGGSWSERPARARTADKLTFPQWQVVFNIGFRVVVE